LNFLCEFSVFLVTSVFSEGLHVSSLSLNTGNTEATELSQRNFVGSDDFSQILD
jgi:hypothetical protein